MKMFLIIYLERRENILNFIQRFNKYRVWHATLFQCLILAPCVFEFDTPDLEYLQCNIIDFFLLIARLLIICNDN